MEPPNRILISGNFSLINFARVAPEFRMEIANQLNDILDLNLKTEQIQRALENQQPQGQPALGQAEFAPANEQQEVTSAATLQGQGIGV